MKINSDIAGNYSINQLNRKSPLQKNEELSEEEKKYFIKKYPEKKDEISDYHFYQKSGKMSGVNIGQHIDRRG